MSPVQENYNATQMNLKGTEEINISRREMQQQKTWFRVTKSLFRSKIDSRIVVYISRFVSVYLSRIVSQLRHDHGPSSGLVKTK